MKRERADLESKTQRNGTLPLIAGLPCHFSNVVLLWVSNGIQPI